MLSSGLRALHGFDQVHLSQQPSEVDSTVYVPYTDGEAMGYRGYTLPLVIQLSGERALMPRLPTPEAVP